MTTDLEAKDQKYNKLMEKLREVQKESKAKTSQIDEISSQLSTSVAKSDHDSELEQLRLDNSEMQKKIKKLLQQLEKSKMAEQPKISTPSQAQNLAYKEYVEITKRVMQYDFDSSVKNNQKRVPELINEIMEKYDSIVLTYQAVENQLIDTKLKHAEAVEAKERLQIELDAINGYQGQPDYTQLVSSEPSLPNKEQKQNSPDGIFAKATNLFSSASNYYKGKLNN